MVCKQAVIWYNHGNIAFSTPIDITTIPGLARLVEGVEATKQSRLLKQDSKLVTVLMPLVRYLNYNPKPCRAP